MAISIRTKDYRSDIVLTLHMTLGGETVNVPQHDFLLRFFTEHEARHYDCGRVKGEWLHCAPDESDATLLTCCIKNHGLGCGMLQCLYVDLSPNDGMEDGVQRTFSVSGIDLELVDDASDDTQAVDGSVIVDINAVLTELHDAADAAIESQEKNVASIRYQQSTVDGGYNVATITQNDGTVHQWKIKNGSKGDKGDKGDTTEGSTGLIFGKLVGNLFYDENGDEADKRADWLYIDKEARSAYRWGAGSFEAIGGSSDWDDKKYAPLVYNGLGRKSLKKNMVSDENVLTAAMLSEAYMEYYIQYDYDLKGASVTLPANVSLIFMGGSIKNGTLIGNNTRIVAKKGAQIFDNITIQGTWDVAEAYSSWFKMHKKGYKIKSVAEISSEEAITLYKGTDNNYYDFEDLTLVGSDYYVTATLVDGEVVESSIKVTATTYATFRVEGYNADSTIAYVAAPLTVPGAFDASGYAQYDDTAALQSLLDLRARKCVIEDGIYIINAEANLTGTTSNAIYTGLFYDNQKDSALEIDGWLKVLQNNKGDGYHDYHALEVIGCENVKICGYGGIQGDLLEHNASSGEYGHNLVVENTKNLTVEGLTSAYAWGDCIYCTWNNGGKRTGTPVGNKLQGNHTFKNVSVIYGGRTGLVYELGDNVLVDSCYFTGCGRARGKRTWSAVDIEPFWQNDTTINYVMNFEFKNNIFKENANGLRLERCLNCSVHDNIFEACWTGVFVISHDNGSYSITGPNDKGWVKSRMAIYNNNIKRCNKGVEFLNNTSIIENINIFTNTFVSCTYPLHTDYATKLKTINIYKNSLYGCGEWYFAALVDCDIHENRSYACNIPNLGALMGGGWQIYLNTIDSCSNSKFHDNWFSLDYNKSVYGLGEYGKEEKYHGLPVANGLSTYKFAQGVNLSKKDKIHFYDNHTSDDFYVNYYGGNTLSGGINSVRTEDSTVLIAGDTFKSKTYGDKGIVISGAILSQPLLEDVRDFADMSAEDTVQYGEIIKNGDYYYICNGSGTVGETWGEGTATFVGKVVQSGSYGTLKIAFTTRGVCTSETRPDTFLFAGRKMWETDTNREIVYNGSDWVEGKEIEAITSSEINTGTSETLKGVTAKLLRDNFYTEGEIDAKLGDVETLLSNI